MVGVFIQIHVFIISDVSLKFITISLCNKIMRLNNKNTQNIIILGEVKNIFISPGLYSLLKKIVYASRAFDLRVIIIQKTTDKFKNYSDQPLYTCILFT